MILSMVRSMRRSTSRSGYAMIFNPILSPTPRAPTSCVRSKLSTAPCCRSTTGATCRFSTRGNAAIPRCILISLPTPSLRACCTKSSVISRRNAASGWCWTTPTTPSSSPISTTTSSSQKRIWIIRSHVSSNCMSWRKANATAPS